MHFSLQEWTDRFKRWSQQGKPKNARVRRWIWGALFFALLTLLTATYIAPQTLDLKEGDTATKPIEAPRPIEDRLATEERRRAAVALIPTQYRVDMQVLEQATQFIDEVFNQINLVRALGNQDEQTKIDDLTARIHIGSPLSPVTFQALIRAEQYELMMAREDAARLAETVLSQQIHANDVVDLRSKIDADVIPDMDVRVGNTQLRVFVKELVKSRIRSNRVEDPEATELLRERAATEVQPVEYATGQYIVREGDTITANQMAMLRELNLVGPGSNLWAAVGAAMVSALLIGLVGIYLLRYRKDLMEQDSKLILLGVIGILTLLLSLLMRAFAGSLGSGVAYLMPFAFNAILVTILLDPKLAMLQSTLLALLGTMAVPEPQLSHAVVGVVGSLAAVYSVSRVESRTDIYRAGFFVAVVNGFTILALGLIQHFTLLDLGLWVHVGLGFLNGLVVAVLVTGALPFFENLFGVVTPLKLLELSNPNHPLLKRLLVEAPGSYHHTILVANLCEAAAESIGADQVLARVGAYYHDIGKAKRPYFFVENQFGGENPHDKLPPSLSALIITSHVKDGVEMAREARLPQEIINFITEHHGTTLVSYFYHLASKNGQSEYILEDDFRYEGPKPRSKETAITMLADSCEAAVRALRQKGPLTMEQIEKQVRRIIEDRLRQGQLENCNLTFHELDTITRTFVKVLSGVHHARIEYPPEALSSGKLPAPGQQGGEQTGEPAPAGEAAAPGAPAPAGEAAPGAPAPAGEAATSGAPAPAGEAATSGAPAPVDSEKPQG